MSDELDRLGAAITNAFTSESVDDLNGAPATMVDAIAMLAVQLKRLGLNDAATSMGAIETLAKEIKEGSESIASALTEVSEALDHIAFAIKAAKK